MLSMEKGMGIPLPLPVRVQRSHGQHAIGQDA
jgi:hypothetical protein